MTPPLLSIREKREPISSLYVLKALCAFVVVACHAPLGAMPLQILTVAVPVFFMITGYFLYSPDYHVVVVRCLRTAKRVLPLYLVLSAVYLLLEYPDIPWPGDAKNVLRWLIVCMARDISPLWYLNALWGGLLVLGAFVSVWKGKYIVGLIPLALLSVVLGPYRELLVGADGASLFVFNFAGYALPCLSVGYLTHRHLDKLRCWAGADVVAICLVLFCVEYYLLDRNTVSFPSMGPQLMTFSMAFSLLILALQHPSLGKGTKMERIGQAYAGNIYYWHMLFVMLFEGEALGQVRQYIDYEGFGTLYVFILSLLFSVGVVGLQRRLGISFFS